MDGYKNLCAQIPISLHERITTQKELLGLPLNQYITNLITEYYERKGAKSMSDTRTLAIQISEKLFERLKTHLKATGKSQKQFLIELIERALDEANA